MGFVRRLRDALTPRTHPPLEAPSEAYPTPVHMYEHLLADLRDNWHEGGWATLRAVRPAPIVVQVTPDGDVNAGLDQVDLPAMLRRAGLDALADATSTTHPGDRSCWRVRDATPAELAQAVHAIFSVHHALGADYAVIGWLEG